MSKSYYPRIFILAGLLSLIGMLCIARICIAETDRTLSHDDQKYLVLLKGTGREFGGKDGVKYREYIYKFVRRSDHFVSKTKWFQVQFIDGEGFSLAADLIHEDDLLLSREYYGYLWIDEARANRIKAARVRALKSEHLKSAKAEKIRTKDHLSELIEKAGYTPSDFLKQPELFGKTLKESFEGSEQDKNILSIEQNLDVLSQDARLIPGTQNEIKATPEIVEEKSASTGEVKEKPVRITNADVQKALSESEMGTAR